MFTILASEPFLRTRFAKFGPNPAAGHGETIQDVCSLLQERPDRSSRLTCIPINTRELGGNPLSTGLTKQPEHSWSRLPVRLQVGDPSQPSVITSQIINWPVRSGPSPTSSVLQVGGRTPGPAAADSHHVPISCLLPILKRDNGRLGDRGRHHIPHHWHVSLSPSPSRSS